MDTVAPHTRIGLTDRKVRRVANLVSKLAMLVTLFALCSLAKGQSFPVVPGGYGQSQPLPAPMNGTQVIPIPPMAPDPENRVQLQSHQDYVTLVTRDAPLSTVLSMIAQQQGLNIVTGEEVSQRVNVTLNNVRLEDALNSILAVHGYTWTRLNNIITISSLSTDRKTSPSVQGRLVRVFVLNYVRASDVDKVIRGLISPVGQSFVNTSQNSGVSQAGGMNSGSQQSSMYSGGQGVQAPAVSGGTNSVQSASATGQAGGVQIQPTNAQEQLVVEDLPSYLDRIAEYIAQVDVLPRQVIVEANILQVTLRDNNRHGVNFNQLARASNARINFETMGLATTATSTSGVPATAMRVAATDLSSVIDLLKSTNDTKTLASPKVAVLNRQEARISVGGKLGYLLTTATNTSTLQSVSFLDFGVVLRVTPVITDDGQILMSVAPQVSTGRINPTSKLPESESTEVETKVMLGNGQAVVIGGLIKETYNDGQNKIPLLGDLWVVGRLFQSRERLKERNEIIITLLPRIVQPGETCVLESEEDVAQATTSLMDRNLNRIDRSMWEGELPDASKKQRSGWFKKKKQPAGEVMSTSTAPMNSSYHNPTPQYVPIESQFGTSSQLYSIPSTPNP